MGDRSSHILAMDINNRMSLTHVSIVSPVINGFRPRPATETIKCLLISVPMNCSERDGIPK